MSTDLVYVSCVLFGPSLILIQFTCNYKYSKHFISPILFIRSAFQVVHWLHYPQCSSFSKMVVLFGRCLAAIFKRLGNNIVSILLACMFVDFGGGHNSRARWTLNIAAAAVAAHLCCVSGLTTLLIMLLLGCSCCLAWGQSQLNRLMIRNNSSVIFLSFQ